MKNKLKVHVRNLKGEERVYNATLKRLLKTNQSVLDDTDKSCFGFETGYSNLFKLFAIGHHLPSVSKLEVSDHLFTAQQYLMLWQRTFVQPAGEIVPFTYQGVDFAIPASGKIQSIPSPEWLEMIYLAIVTGRHQDLNLLMGLLNSDQVFHRAELQSLHCEIVLHMLGLKDSEDISGAINQLTALVDSKESLIQGKWAPFHAITITLGFFDVMKNVHQQDQDAYRNAMYRALEMHKEWWTHDKDFSQRAQGYVAMPLLAAARYAYEKYGLTLDFECGYLPSYIYLI
ncbi:Imm49 family immunity protein [Vibrio coralliilyticus]|uniref:Imm49 family immunity protein n=1 Tax=Vibrio coralliilyticus TaxID=190893 RepID=UPI002FD12A3A